MTSRAAKLLIYSRTFSPNVGGQERIVEFLARGFALAGYQVCVVTETPGSCDELSSLFEVLRQPSFLQLLRKVRWADLYLQASLSLRGLWPAWMLGKNVFVSHHTFYSRTQGVGKWLDWVKRYCTCFTRNAAPSLALVQSLPGVCELIPNTYDHETFRLNSSVERTRELIFVGRLVSDKGVDTLLEALALLRRRDLGCRLTVVGDGPERTNLKGLAKSLGLSTQVDFTGVLSGNDLSDVLNQHQILVVPSRWIEPFGIVALEGIACGCAVIGSSEGGLPAAIGPCGVLFRNGDAAELAARIEQLTTSPGAIQVFRSRAAGHLKGFQQPVVLERYLAFLEAGMARTHAS